MAISDRPGRGWQRPPRGAGDLVFEAPGVEELLRDWSSATESLVPSRSHRLGVEMVTEALREHFKDCGDIEAIYLNDKHSYFSIIIITNHETYDRDGMNDLFKHEHELRQELRRRGEEVLLQFDYLPRFGRDFEDIVPVTANPVFRR